MPDRVPLHLRSFVQSRLSSGSSEEESKQEDGPAVLSSTAKRFLARNVPPSYLHRVMSDLCSNKQAFHQEQSSSGSDTQSDVVQHKEDLLEKHVDRGTPIGLNLQKNIRGAYGWEGCKSCASTGFRSGKRKNASSTVPCKSCGGRGIRMLAVQEQGLVTQNEQKRQKLSENADVKPETVEGQDSRDDAFKPKRQPLVVIIGGGIGGCALALALQQRNIECVVFEKDERFDQRAQGYGLTMQQGSTTLRRLGFTDLKRFGISSESHASLLPDGTLLNEYGRTIHSTTKEKGGNGKGDAQRFNIQLPRQLLRQMLFDALRPGTVQWGFRFDSYKLLSGEGSKRVRTFLTDTAGERRHIDADLLVGADGIWSKVRVQKMGISAPQARYLGVIVILGRAPCRHPLADNKVFQTLGGATRLYCMPFEEGVTMWQLSFPMRLEEARALSAKGSSSLLEEAIRRCSDWHEPIPDLLKTTKPQDVTGYPAYDRPAPHIEESGPCQGLIACGDPSSHDSVILIGDAAHPMSPFKGQGANQALIDGWSLAKHLCSVPLDQTPFQTFEQEMVERVRPKVEKSAHAAVVLHTTKSVQVRCSRQVT